jgi:hypothetical protein
MVSELLVHGRPAGRRGERLLAIAGGLAVVAFVVYRIGVAATEGTWDCNVGDVDPGAGWVAKPAAALVGLAAWLAAGWAVAVGRRGVRVLGVAFVLAWCPVLLYGALAGWLASTPCAMS